MASRIERNLAKRVRKLEAKRDAVFKWLESKGVEAERNHKAVIGAAYKVLGQPEPKFKNGRMETMHAFYNMIFALLGITKLPKQKAAKPPAEGRKPRGDQFRAFYESYAWRRARYQVLKEHGAVCQVCGATRADGVQIHVDHIKPLRHFWDLRLDPDNLQVLCGVCNHGKGNWDQTDWRPSA